MLNVEGKKIKNQEDTDATKLTKWLTLIKAPFYFGYCFSCYCSKKKIVLYILLYQFNENKKCYMLHFNFSLNSLVIVRLHLPSVPFSVRGGSGFGARCVVNMRKMWKLQLVIVLCYFLWIQGDAATAITDPQKRPHRDILFLLLANYN